MSDEEFKEIDEQYVLNQYNSKIKYYWKASNSNKKLYKRFRTWTIILGALVTLVSSISAAEFIQTAAWSRILFAVVTPIIAAVLTILGGMAQSFHWGATWRDMVVNATLLEKERDRFLATKPGDRDLKQELKILDEIVLEETKNFFQRVLDSEVKPPDKRNELPG